MARSESSSSYLHLGYCSAVHVKFTTGTEGILVQSVNAGACDGKLDADSLRAFAAKLEPACLAVTTVLPRHQATLRFLEVPSQDSTEIASMVALAAEDFAPYPLDQLMVRHHIVDRLPTGSSRIVVVLVHSDVVEKHLTLLRDAGFEAEHIAFSTACYHAAVAASPDAPEGRFGLVCIAEDAVELLVMNEDRLEFSRGFSHHAPWALEDATGRAALAYEIRDALAAYRRESEDGEGCCDIFLTADVPVVETLFTDLEEMMGRPCRPATFLESAVRTVGNGVDDVPTCAIGAMRTAAGVAPLRFDFLPDRLVRHREARALYAQAARVAVGVAIVFVLLLAAFGQSVYQRVAFIRELRAQASQLAPGVENILERQRGLEAMMRQIDEGHNFLALLAAVISAAPSDGLNITRVEFDRVSGMNLWGRARDKDIVLGDFLGHLRELGRGSLAQLGQAHSQYETPGLERNQNIINYHIAIPALPEESAHVAPSPDR